MSKTYWPCVLIVDDDEASCNYLTERFHDETSLGVITADTLRVGRDIVQNDDLAVDGIIADLHFERGTDDPEHEMYDGIDLLSYASERRPGIPQYIVSFFADKLDFRTKAKNCNLSPENWYPKGPVVGTQPEAPWSKIEHDLIQHRLATDKDVQAMVEIKSGKLEGLVSDVLRNLKLPRRTYIQHLGRAGRNYKVVRPIEVVCVLSEEGTFRASAWRTGIISEGYGDTVCEALNDLRDIVLDQVLAFEQTDTAKLTGYAQLVYSQLGKYVVREGPDEEQ